MFRELADAYPNAANRAAPPEIIGAGLCCIACVQPVKETKRKRGKKRKRNLNNNRLYLYSAFQGTQSALYCIHDSFIHSFILGDGKLHV